MIATKERDLIARILERANPDELRDWAVAVMVSGISLTDAHRLGTDGGTLERDELGPYTVCPHCGGSFDIDLTTPPEGNA